MKQISTLLFSLLFFASIPVSAQYTPVNPALATALQNKLETELTNRNFKGASVTVIYPDNKVWNGAAGLSHGMVSIDSSMVFGVGSITKTMVATTILLLQEDSLLSVNDSLHQWLPTYPNINPNITIKQLLQHRSGLYNYTTNNNWGMAVNNDFTAHWTADSVLYHYINPPIAQPGSTFGYCNTNYLLLGRIIEEATDSAWWQVLRHRILAPQQLNHIYAEGFEPRPGVFAHNWQVVSGNNLVDLEANLPSQDAIFTSANSAGMMASNAFDLARFGELLFEGNLLEPASLNQMKQFSSIPGSLLTGYGFGLFRVNNLGQTVWGHGGKIPGFSSFLFYSPSDSITLSILINQDGDELQMGLAMLRAAKDFLANTPENNPGYASLNCYPNPTAGTGFIQFYMPENGKAEITLLSALGQEVLVVAHQEFEAGKQSLEVNTSHMAEGLYFCRLNTEAGVSVQRWLIKK